MVRIREIHGDGEVADRWSTGGRGRRRSDDAGSDAGGDTGRRVHRNRKWLAVSYRTAFHTEAELSEGPLIRCGGDAWQRPDVTL